jgi:hypothetical protein
MQIKNKNNKDIVCPGAKTNPAEITTRKKHQDAQFVSNSVL